MRIVHLPYFEANPYQRLLMDAQRRRGHTVIPGGAGGGFIRTLLRKWRPDIVHVHWIHPYVGSDSRWSTLGRGLWFLACVAAIRLSGCRLVWTIHNLRNHARRFETEERFVTRWFSRFATRFITHSRAAARMASSEFRLSAERIDVIPHGNYIDAYPRTVDASSARQGFGVDPGAFVYAFVGRVEPYKGVLELIEAFGGLPGECRLRIAGSCENADYAAQLAEKASGDGRVTLELVSIPDEALQHHLIGAEVVVFPYRDVLTSGAVILAMSFGRPVIVPDRGGLRETVPQQGGFFFEPDEPGSLAAALRAAHDQRDRLDGAGKTNLAAAKEWDWDVIAARTDETYSAAALCSRL